MEICWFTYENRPSLVWVILSPLFSNIPQRITALIESHTNAIYGFKYFLGQQFRDNTLQMHSKESKLCLLDIRPKTLFISLQITLFKGNRVQQRFQRAVCLRPSYGDLIVYCWRWRWLIYKLPRSMMHESIFKQNNLIKVLTLFATNTYNVHQNDVLKYMTMFTSIY